MNMVKQLFIQRTTLIAVSLLVLNTQATNAQISPPVREKEQLPIPQPLEPKTPPIDKPPLQPSLPDVDIPPCIVNKFLFIDNTVFTSKQLEAVVSKYIGRELNVSELTEARNEITEYYVRRGYINSGAAILIADNPSLNLSGANLYIRVIEGKLGAIKVNGSRRLNKYVSNRVKQQGAFNYNKLEKSLFLLQDDELVKDIKGSLNPESTGLLNVAELNIDVLAEKHRATVFANNNHNPNSGTFERGVSLTALNPSTLGDKLEVIYRNTSGSNSISTSYKVPLNTQNTTLSFFYQLGNNSTIERPFNNLDLIGVSEAYSVSIRHPVFRNVNEASRSEFAVSMSLEHLESQDQILGFDFPITRGANDSGQIKTTALRFGQDWRYRDKNQDAFLSSQFSLGIDLGSTTGPNFNKGQYFLWRGNALWNRKLPWELSLLSKVGLQFSNRLLASSEQFSLGGAETVRGYRQDGAQADNGIFSSLELRIPIYNGKTSKLALSPFIDVGYGWDNFGLGNQSDLIASTGLSLQYTFSDRLSANFTWGVPLLEVTNEKKSLQEQGLLFSLKWSVF
jgi:hemolysin activation/secretion protein